MNALVSPEVLAKIEEANKYHVREMERNIQIITTNEVAKQKLGQAGVEYTYLNYANVISVLCDDHNIKTDFLKKVHSILGRLQDTGDREIVDSRRHIIQISLKAVSYPGVRVKYHHKLGKNDKCKIVTEKTSKTRVQKYKTVVCGK